MSHDQTIAKYFARYINGDESKKILIDNYIDQSEDPKQLRLFLSEFGAATGAVFALPRRVTEDSSTANEDAIDNPNIFSNTSTRSKHLILVRTPNYMPAGSVWVEKVFSRAKNVSELTYNYRADHIVKERARHGHKHVRTSTKIKSMLTAMKKANEVPTEVRIADAHLHEIRNSVNYSLSKNISDARVNLTPRTQLDLMLRAIDQGHGLSNSTLEEIKSVHEKYLKESADVNEQKKTLNRYLDNGFWAIGIASNSTAARPVFYVIEMKRENNEFAPTNGLLRYMNSLESIEPVHMAFMFAKPFFEKTTGVNRTNPYNIPRTDKYFEDVDIAVGYQRDTTWAFVPKVSE